MALLHNGKKRPVHYGIRQHLLLSLGIITAMPADAAEQTLTQWSCTSDAEGKWQCVEEVVPGKAFYRSRRTSALPTRAEDEPRVRLTTNLDWVNASQMTEEQRQHLPSGCCGAYIEPVKNYPDSELDPEQAPVRVGASATEAQGNIARLEGDVQVSQGYRQIRSDHAVIDQGARTVQLEDNIQLREPGLLMLGGSAYVNIDSGDVRMNDATYVLHEMGIRGTASRLSRAGDGVIFVDDATYTSCEPGSNAWSLVSSNISVDVNTNIVEARHVRLHIKDWPVFYFPWMRYSLSENRTSGLLFPHLSTSNDNGFDYAQPIYLNLAPNYDATLTPRLVEERGTMAEVEMRHMSRYTHSEFSGAYLWEDKGGKLGETSPDPVTGLLPYEGSDRWLINVEHIGGLKRDWSTLVDYTEVSDSDYFLDLDNATLEVSSRSHLNQAVAVGYRTDNWRSSITAQKYQTIAKTLILDENGIPQNILEFKQQYQQMPRLELNGDYRFNSTDLTLTLNHEFTLFEHADDDTPNSGAGFNRDSEDTQITGNRLRANYQLAWDRHWLWGYFRPGVQMSYLAYDLRNPVKNSTDTRPTLAVPASFIDAGLQFERDNPWRDESIQTLEPRIFYLNSRFKDQSELPNFDTSEMTFTYQQLFRTDRFTGGDRVGDAEQVTLGITTRLIDADTGREQLHASIGQIFYLADRRVSLNPLISEAVFNDPSLQENLNLTAQDDLQSLTRDQSDYAAELGAQIWGDWRVQTDILYDRDTGLVNKGNVSFRFNNQGTGVVNLSYRYTRRDENPTLSEPDQDIEQTDASFFLPVSMNWRIIGRWNHDLTNSRELEVFTGLEYNDCCWRASLVARRWLDRDDTATLPEENLVHDKGIFFQVLFKGLAGSSSSVDNILTDSIYGYQQPER